MHIITSSCSGSVFVHFFYFQDRAWGKGANRGCKLLQLFILFYLLFSFFTFFLRACSTHLLNIGSRLGRLQQVAPRRLPIWLMSRSGSVITKVFSPIFGSKTWPLTLQKWVLRSVCIFKLLCDCLPSVCVPLTEKFNTCKIKNKKIIFLKAINSYLRASRRAPRSLSVVCLISSKLFSNFRQD